jgi:hypothetical protein
LILVDCRVVAAPGREAVELRYPRDDVQCLTILIRMKEEEGANAFPLIWADTSVKG